MMLTKSSRGCFWLLSGASDIVGYRPGSNNLKPRGTVRHPVHAVASTLLVVESPAKAQKIQKFLGDGYKVLASYGHVRDLPAKRGAVDPEDNFAMTWVLQPKSVKHVEALVTAAKDSSALVLATDPDREGEAISWHVWEELKSRKALRRGMSVQRITFTEVTKKAIQAALEKPREVSQALVDAYFARRSLDFLVGFSVSPILWKCIQGAKSAGRVQSVALRLVSERETEIEQFIPEEYWDVEAALRAGGEGGAELAAMVTHFEGKKLKKMSLKSGG